MSNLFTQGPGRPTWNSQHTGIADTLLSFGRRKTLPPPSAWDNEALVPTVVWTPATLLESPTFRGRCSPNPFHASMEEVPEVQVIFRLPEQLGVWKSSPVFCLLLARPGPRLVHKFFRRLDWTGKNQSWAVFYSSKTSLDWFWTSSEPV